MKVVNQSIVPPLTFARRLLLLIVICKAPNKQSAVLTSIFPNLPLWICPMILDRFIVNNVDICGALDRHITDGTDHLLVDSSSQDKQMMRSEEYDL